jgi:hypothetical protein
MDLTQQRTAGSRAMCVECGWSFPDEQMSTALSSRSMAEALGLEHSRSEAHEVVVKHTETLIAFPAEMPRGPRD